MPAPFEGNNCHTCEAAKLPYCVCDHPVTNLGNCSCGQPYESIYSQFTKECRSCERRRESELYIY
jgi:hypothetical protein